MACLTAGGRATSRSSPVDDELVDSLVLAEGEATGHAHVIEGSILTATAGGRVLLNVLHGAITHPDHDPVAHRARLVRGEGPRMRLTRLCELLHRNMICAQQERNAKRRRDTAGTLNKNEM